VDIFDQICANLNSSVQLVCSARYTQNIACSLSNDNVQALAGVAHFTSFSIINSDPTEQQRHYTLSVLYNH
jgi:hypothetical protein